MTVSSVNSVEGLRSSIEEETRFPNAVGGYQKKAVNDYIARQAIDYGKIIDSLKLEIHAKTEEIDLLQAKLVKLINSESDIRADERAKHASELGIQSGVIESLRKANDRLTEENRTLQLELSSLSQKLTEVNRNIDSGGDSLLELKESLRKMIDSKFSECGDLLDAWEKEYSGVIERVKLNYKPE